MDFLDEELKNLEEKGLYRRFKTLLSAQDVKVKMGNKIFINFCSNDYLGLANHPYVKRAAIKAIERYGVGAGASRLICGNMKLHEELEEKLAKFKKAEASIVFSTGYMANLGVISALLNVEDVVIVDRLNHASIIDGCKLSKAKIMVYSHVDLNDLEKVLKKVGKFRRRLIITDSIFSMDGDLAPLPDIMKLARKYHSMVMVDDAHATGVLGKNGRGIVEYYNLIDKPDIIMGTLSKALGSLGGFICGKKSLIEYLKNKCRSFIYTTGIPSSLCAASMASLEIIEKDPKIIKKLWDNTNYFKKQLNSLNLNTLNSTTPIIPIVLGDEKKTMEVANKIQEKGMLVLGIRPPTVPKGTSRLRITITSKHSKTNIDSLVLNLKSIGSRRL
ncbi:MAG: 8-amino-7-oxononanoate synthase [Candidatus Firestonebacteria bacterium]